MLSCFTLTFDSSPIKGEGEYGWFGLVVAARPLPLWIADQVRNDGAGYVVGVVLFTLTLVLSHQGRGGFGRLFCLVVYSLSLYLGGGYMISDNVIMFLALQAC